MDIVVFQRLAVQNGLNINETLVYSLLRTFGNAMSVDEIISSLMIIKELAIRKSVKSLLEKELIVFEVVNRVKFYEIKK